MQRERERDSLIFLSFFFLFFSFLLLFSLSVPSDCARVYVFVCQFLLGHTLLKEVKPLSVCLTVRLSLSVSLSLCGHPTICSKICLASCAISEHFSVLPQLFRSTQVRKEGLLRFGAEILCLCSESRGWHLHSWIIHQQWRRLAQAPSEPIREVTGNLSPAGLASTWSKPYFAFYVV